MFNDFVWSIFMLTVGGVLGFGTCALLTVASIADDNSNHD